MDPVLSSLFPVHQIGSDGFSWWVGQVEDTDDPKKGARVRVRIVGQHLKECDAVPTEELPWASVMMPVTTPYSDGGVTGASSNLNVGNWVIGFYLDNSKQKPVVIGSIGHVPGSTKITNEEPNPGGKCKSFTTFIPPELNPPTDLPASEQSGTASADNEVGYEEGSRITGAEPIAASRSGEEGGLPPTIQGVFENNNENNPAGGKFCVVIANPNCGAEKNLKTGLQKIVSEMLAANQNSSGQLGDYYVSKVNGLVNEQVSNGRYHINRAVRLVKSSVARVKGEIITELRNGVTELVDVTLYKTETQIVPDDIDRPLTGAQLDAIEAADIAREEAIASGDADAIEAADIEYTKLQEQINGERGHPTIKKKESRIKGIQNFLEDALNEIGCSIVDLTEKLAQWLTDILLGYLEDAYNAASCLIDELINGILSEILGFVDEIINKILGGLQAILSNLAEPLNIIGGILNKVMNLLGISCSGPESQCEKIQVKCTDCGVDAEEDDFLDKLIAAVEDGDLDFNNSVCDEARNYPEPEPTNIIFIGGIPLPPDAPGSRSTGQTTNSPVSSGSNQSTTTYGSINYDCSDVTVFEGGQAIFTITRSGAINVASSLTIASSDGSATAGQDYDAVTPLGSLAFAPSETSKTVTFDTYTDTVTEGEEDFYFSIDEEITPAGYYVYFNSGNDFACKITDASFATNPPPPSSTPTPVSGSSVVTSPTAQYQTYSVVPDKIQVDEGDSVLYTITTTNVNDGEVLSYTLSGDIDASDIVSSTLTGTFVINNNTAQVTIQIASNDDITGADDDPENLTFSIDNTNAFATVTITGETSTTPTYAVTADKTSVDEGDKITYTITTTNVADNTVLDYTLSGVNIISDDIVGGSLTGSATITSDTATVEVEIVSDSVVESSEILTFSIDNTTASVDVIINGDSTIPDITDTEDKDLTTTYNVTSDKFSYYEGEAITYSVTTTNVPDNTKLTYSLFGTGITAEDFTLKTLTGSFVIIDNKATVIVGIEEDTEVEISERVTFTIDNTGVSTDVTILDKEDEKNELKPEPTKPCLSKPTAKELTDKYGRLINIEVDDKGCPYIVPPKIIITGKGYGAAAIPLLDNDGFVSEVRIVRQGMNYRKNTPDDLNCIIDSFTLIKPGSGYRSEPKVYVNGNPNVARAIVEDGFIKSIEVLDRTINYETLPSIKIVGGGGYGARFLPSLSCLDPDELERRGYAKIGTGKYIDCP